MSKKIIEILTTIIPFLNPYPLWVKSIIAIWIIGLAVIIVILIFTYPPNMNKDSAKDKSPVNNQTNIDKVEGDYVAGNKNVTNVYKKETSSDIKISPDEIILNANQWKGKSSFNIYNGTGEMFYDLYIKLELKDSGISSEDIELTPRNNSDFMKGQIGNMSISFDIIQFKGIDGNGKECIYLILYSLAPNQNQDFLVGLGKLLNISNGQIHIFVKLMQSSKLPPNMLSRGNEVSYPIRFPENFTVREQSILMKKEKG